jgi:hypothetical protein
MNNNYWIETLKQLADDPADFDSEGGKIIFMRRGQEIELTLKNRPSVGLSVVREIEGRTDFLPISIYIQQHLLELPLLAAQIQRTISKNIQKRVSHFVEAPAVITQEGETNQAQNSSTELSELIQISEPSVTTIIQLMAKAGNGKTVLIEQVAQSHAGCYSASDSPIPIVLVVDLLGRFVGTIDDAIAGALNNSYNFPSLRQRDVIVAVKNRWMTLALDGFDELVARIGAKDAFMRISDLLDQLEGSGQLIISARDSFFELQRVSSAINSYLQPQKGSYATISIRLLPWGPEHGIKVLETLNSASPDEDFRMLRSAFPDDTILSQPFFLTRLADLWVKGNRFTNADKSGDVLARKKYVINCLLEREVTAKWIDRNRVPIIPDAIHEKILQTIADEMLRTNAYFMSEDEISIAVEVALNEFTLQSDVANNVIARFPTHAFLQKNQRGFHFAHDMYLYYYLARAVTHGLEAGAQEANRYLESRILLPEVLEWVSDDLANKRCDAKAILENIACAKSISRSRESAVNIGELAPALLTALQRQDTDLKRQTFCNLIFSERTFAGKSIKGGIFIECEFLGSSFAGATFIDCEFRDCEFNNIKISDSSDFTTSNFSAENTYRGLEVEESSRLVYSPEEIVQRLKLAGATIGSGRAPILTLADEVNPDLIYYVEQLVKHSQRNWDICVEEYVEKVGESGDLVIRTALEHGILRNWPRETGGPRKTFVRFIVDRDNLMKCLAADVADPKLSAFWRKLDHAFSEQ